MDPENVLDKPIPERNRVHVRRAMIFFYIAFGAFAFMFLWGFFKGLLRIHGDLIGDLIALPVLVMFLCLPISLGNGIVALTKKEGVNLKFWIAMGINLLLVCLCAALVFANIQDWGSR